MLGCLFCYCFAFCLSVVVIFGPMILAGALPREGRKMKPGLPAHAGLHPQDQRSLNKAMQHGGPRPAPALAVTHTGCSVRLNVIPDVFTQHARTLCTNGAAVLLFITAKKEKESLGEAWMFHGKGSVDWVWLGQMAATSLRLCSFPPPNPDPCLSSPRGQDGRSELCTWYMGP